MLNKYLISALMLTVWAGIIKPVQAELHDRGGGLLYDDALNITWLQDANYAKTCGASPGGAMGWAEAQKWVGKLVYYDPVRKVELRCWRLPKVKPVNGVAFTGKFSLDGTSDEGYNITSLNSELAYMFYVNLKLKGYYSTTGEVQPGFGTGGNGKWDVSANTGLVKNFRASVYWTGTDDVSYPLRNAWMFDAYWGNQNFYNKWDVLLVWPVRDGDVTATPTAQQDEPKR